MTVSVLSLGALSDDEQRQIRRLTDQLDTHRRSNVIKNCYYEARQSIQNIGIAIPQEVVSKVRPVVGWASTVVDVLEERLDWYGWAGARGDSLGLDEIYNDNTLDVESGLGHLDSLIYGVSFIRVHSGNDGEPHPLVSVSSPLDTTGIWDRRTRRLRAALTVTDVDKDGNADQIVLDQIGETTTLERLRGAWTVVDRDDHGLPWLPVIRMSNRMRASRIEGQSEITKAIRYYCDGAVRTILGMEGNREFYSIPQLTVLGRGADAFVDKDGRPTEGWKVLAGHALAIDKDDEGDVPTISQLQVGSPQPFLDQLRGWAQMVSTEAGLPVNYLGFVSDNPASADAIRAMEARLVKRAERRQTNFGRAWLEVARMALLLRDGSVPTDFASVIGNRWRDPSTPTRAATADETTKYVSAGVLPVDSTVTYDRIGLTPDEQNRLENEKRRSRGLATFQGIRSPQVAPEAAGDPTEAPDGAPEDQP